MYPTITIVCIQRQTVIHAKHDSQIPNFNTLTVSQQNAKPTYCSIISYTFKCNIHFTIGILSFNLQPFCTTGKVIHISSFDCSYNTNNQRSSIISFLTRINNCLKSGECFNLSLAICNNIASHCFGSFRCHIKNLCIFFQRTIILICPYP